MNLFRSVFDKFNYRPNYETSSSFRMTLRLKKFFSPSVRQVLTIIGIILMKCWRNILLLLTIFCIILVLLGFWYIIFFTPLAVVYFLWKLSDDLIYHPDSPPDSRKNVASPSTVQLPFTDLYLTTEDNVKIHCMFIQQRDLDSRSSGESPATFLYLHGNAGNIGHRLNNVAELFHFLKVNILLVEYRGYGYSQGRPSEKGLYKDAQAALEFLHKKANIDKNKIILYGRSLGAAVAINLATVARYRNAFSCLIVENTFTNLPDIAKIVVDNVFIKWLPNWVFGNRYDSISKISNIKVPILFLSGLADEIIPPSMMTSLFQTSTSPMKLIHTFPNGNHNFTWRCDGYYQVINNFLIKVFTDYSHIETFLTNDSDNLSGIDQIHTSEDDESDEDEIETSTGIYHRLPV